MFCVEQEWASHYLCHSQIMASDRWYRLSIKTVGHPIIQHLEWLLIKKALIPHLFHSQSLSLLAVGPNFQKLEELISMDLSGQSSQTIQKSSSFFGSSTSSLQRVVRNFLHSVSNFKIQRKVTSIGNAAWYSLVLEKQTKTIC